MRASRTGRLHLPALADFAKISPQAPGLVLPLTAGLTRTTTPWQQAHAQRANWCSWQSSRIGETLTTALPLSVCFAGLHLCSRSHCTGRELSSKGASREPTVSGALSPVHAFHLPRCSPHVWHRYLRKENSAGKWQKRWFEVVGRYFVYYKRSDSPNMLCAMDLWKAHTPESACRCVLCATATPHPRRLVPQFAPTKAQVAPASPPTSSASNGTASACSVPRTRRKPCDG